MKIFSVYDSKAEAYMSPFVLPSPAHAIRQMANLLVGDRETPFSDYPEDFTLMELGDWDQVSGSIKPHPAFISHGNLQRIKGSLVARRTQIQNEKGN